MSKRDNVQHFPDRAEVEHKLVDLIEGRITRDEAHDWAIKIWINEDRIDVTDRPAWGTVGHLTGADAISTDRPFLYDKGDFQNWLAELRSTPDPK